MDCQKSLQLSTPGGVPPKASITPLEEPIILLITNLMLCGLPQLVNFSYMLVFSHIN